jgi:hypothetical protein
MDSCSYGIVWDAQEAFEDLLAPRTETDVMDSTGPPPENIAPDSSSPPPDIHTVSGAA